MAPRDPRTLWRVQLALEGKALDPDCGRLIRTPCDDPDDLATCYIASYPDGGSEVVFAETAPRQFVHDARQLSVQAVMHDPTAAAGRLSTGPATATVGHYHTYCFDHIDQPANDHVTLNGPEQFSITVDGAYAAGASSSRSNPEAAELWIETELTYRRRGYATTLAQHWAYGIHASGRIAFYSHHHSNDASRALAHRLGVRPLFELVGITIDSGA